MKRTIPLLITAAGGFVLIVAFFIPATENWGEKAAIWFDILASIAFVLGGGNLLKVHLQKVSDARPGWGYSLVTVLAFLVTLFVGLAKFGTHPAPQQEFYGETFAELPLTEFPNSQVTRVSGSLPTIGDRERLPASVVRQLSAADGQLVFRGWMSLNQRQDLLGYDNTLEWKATVERLAAAAQPPEELRGKIAYYPDHEALAFAGAMSDEDQLRLAALSDAATWQRAVDQLAAGSRRVTEVEAAAAHIPADVEVPPTLESKLTIDRNGGRLEIIGPLSAAERAALADQFPKIRPLSDPALERLENELAQRGPELTEAQQTAMRRAANTIWTIDQLRLALDAAGQPQAVPKSYGEMLAEKQTGAKVIEPATTVGTATELNPEQVQWLQTFSETPEMTVEDLSERMKTAGTWTPAQNAALMEFASSAPTVGAWRKDLAFELMRSGTLSAEQRDWLLEDYRRAIVWRRTVGRLFMAAHQPKYPWSGDYSEEGSPFWWIYEFIFKPLTATMFAMLAFYVASAAFRAFRAKNLEAILLLGTAFIILLGRTFTGVVLTDWLPDSLSGLRIDNLTVYIMSVFNTAGNRAIMIGIALGIASTSLKVLLGVDRSYLGSGDQ